MLFCSPQENHSTANDSDDEQDVKSDDRKDCVAVPVAPQFLSEGGLGSALPKASGPRGTEKSMKPIRTRSLISGTQSIKPQSILSKESTESPNTFEKLEKLDETETKTAVDKGHMSKSLLTQKNIELQTLRNFHNLLPPMGTSHTAREFSTTPERNKDRRFPKSKSLDFLVQSTAEETKSSLSSLSLCMDEIDRSTHVYSVPPDIDRLNEEDELIEAAYSKCCRFLHLWYSIDVNSLSKLELIELFREHFQVGMDGCQ